MTPPAEAGSSAVSPDSESTQNIEPQPSFEDSGSKTSLGTFSGRPLNFERRTATHAVRRKNGAPPSFLGDVKTLLGFRLFGVGLCFTLRLLGGGFKGA